MDDHCSNTNFQEYSSIKYVHKLSVSIYYFSPFRDAFHHTGYSMHRCHEFDRLRQHRSEGKSCIHIEWEQTIRRDMRIDQWRESLPVPLLHAIEPDWFGQHLLYHQRIDIDRQLCSRCRLSMEISCSLCWLLLNSLFLP